MADGNGFSSTLTRVLIGAMFALIVGWLGWLSVGFISFREGSLSRIDVLAAEKIRNEDDIANLQARIACLSAGECGDRQTKTMTTLQSQTRDEQHNAIWLAITHLEDNCLLHGGNNAPR